MVRAGELLCSRYDTAIHMSYGAVTMMASTTGRYRLNVYRNSDGKLKVNINKVNPDNQWNAGNGVLFRNRLSPVQNNFVWAGVFFSKPFFQPPRILPTSLSFSDNSA